MSYNLNDILKEAVGSLTHQQNFFALACGLAREAVPNPQTLQLLAVLCDRSPDHWLEIVRRLSKNHLNFLLTCYGNNIKMYSGLAEAVMAQPNEQWKIGMLNQVVKSIEQPQSISVQQLFRTLSDILQHLKPNSLMDCLLTNHSLVNLLIQNLQSTHNDYNTVVLILLQRYRKLQREHLASTNLQSFQSHFAPLYNFMKLYMENCQNLKILRQIYPCWSMSSHTLDKMSNISLVIVNHLNKYNMELRNMLNKLQHNQPEVMQQIINYEYDMIEQRKSDTQATSAASLLVQLCEYVDGTLSKMFRSSLNSIQDIVQKAQLNNIYHLEETTSIAARMELFYLILCLISPLIQQRQDLVEDLQQFLFQHSDKIFLVSDRYPMVAFRTVKFIECYSRYLNGRLFDQATNMLIRTIREASNSLYGQQALQTLQNMVKSMPKKMEVSIMDLINFLIEMVPTTQNYQLFDMLLFILQNYEQTVERYAISLVSLLSVRIGRQLKSPLVYKLFDCLTQVIKTKDVFDQDYMNMDELLMMLTGLLKTHGFQTEVLRIAATTVEKGEGLNYFAIDCLKYLRSIYEKSYTLKDVGLLIENCCLYASKQILGQEVNIIRLFSDILLDNIQKVIQEDSLSEVCQLLQIQLQAFQDYYKDVDEERQHIQRVVIALMDKGQKIPIDMVLICLFSIRPFDKPVVTPQLTLSRQINKMYLLYLAIRLRMYFSVQLLDQAMIFLDQYKTWLVSSKKSKPSQMEMEDSDEEYRHTINEKHALKRKNVSDKLTLMRLDELETLKRTVESLRKQQLLNFDIKQKTRRIMDELQNTFTTGVSIRQYHRIQKKP